MIGFYLITNGAAFTKMPEVRLYPRHLLLAPVLKACPEALRTAKHLRETRGDSIRIILDNGAYEGQLMSPNEYLRMCRELRPQVVVLPDLVGTSWKESHKLSQAFLYTLRASGTWGHSVDAMFVPQGDSKEANLEAYQHAIETLDPETVILGFGLSHRLWHEPRDGNIRASETPRIRMVEAVMKLPGARKFRYHILGARKVPTGIYANMASIGFARIVGLDSYKPFRLACGDTLQESPTGRMLHTGTILPGDNLLFPAINKFCASWKLFNGPEVFEGVSKHRKQKD